MGAYLCKDAEHAKQAKQDETENQMLPASEKIKKQEKEEVVDGENPDIPFADANADEDDVLINETPGKIVNDYNRSSADNQYLNEDSHSHVPVATNVTNEDRHLNHHINEEKNVVEIKEKSSESCENQSKEETCPEKSQDLNEHISHDSPLEIGIDVAVEEHEIQKQEITESQNPSAEHEGEAQITNRISNVPEIIDQSVAEEVVIDKHEEQIQNPVEIHDESINVEVNNDLIVNVSQDIEVCDNHQADVDVDQINVDSEIQKSTETDDDRCECIAEAADQLVITVEESANPSQSPEVLEKQEYEFQESSEIEKELVNIINEEHVKDLSEIEAIQKLSDDSILLGETEVSSEKIDASHDQAIDILLVEESHNDIVTEILDEKHASQIECSQEREHIENEAEMKGESIIVEKIEDEKTCEEETYQSKEEPEKMEDHVPCETELCHENVVIDDQVKEEPEQMMCHEASEGMLFQTNEETLKDDHELVQEISQVNEEPEKVKDHEETCQGSEESIKVTDHEACHEETCQCSEESIKVTDHESCEERLFPTGEDAVIHDQVPFEEELPQDKECFEEKQIVEERENVKECENEFPKEHKGHCGDDEEVLVEDQDYDEELIIEDQDHSDDLVEESEQVKGEAPKSEECETKINVECHETEDQHQMTERQAEEMNAIGDIELTVQSISTNCQSKSEANESDDQSFSNEIEVGNELEDVKEEELIKMVSDAVEEIMGDAKIEVQHIVENSASNENEPSIEALES